MSAVTSPPRPSLLDAVERNAWRIRLPTRRLFVLLALTVAAALAASGLFAAWAVAHNAATIDEARSTGLGIARAATQFRTNLAAADAEAAATLISGGLEEPARRIRYDADVLQAGRALTDAGLVATAADAEDIAALADGLVRYAGLVETSRANSRQGFPVGSAYLNQARAMARDELVPRADRLRRSGEQRMARAANSVAGPVGAVAVALLVLALMGALAAAVVVAGRTRRVAHPALIAAVVAIVAAGVVVTSGLLSQRRELRTAATSDIGTYVRANDAAFTLSNLRVSEIGAVAAHGSGAPLYAQFHTDAEALVARLGDSDTGSELRPVLQRYLAGVDDVEAADSQGNNRGAADGTLSGASATGYQAASEEATTQVEAAASTLGQRLDKAAGADVEPLVPIALGLVAAALAATGTLARARRYR